MRTGPKRSHCTRCSMAVESIPFVPNRSRSRIDHTPPHRRTCALIFPIHATAFLVSAALNIGPSTDAV